MKQFSDKIVTFSSDLPAYQTEGPYLFRNTTAKRGMKGQMAMVPLCLDSE